MFIDLALCSTSWKSWSLRACGESPPTRGLWKDEMACVLHSGVNGWVKAADMDWLAGNSRHFWGSQTRQQKPTHQAALRRAIWVTEGLWGEKQRSSPGVAAASVGPVPFHRWADSSQGHGSLCDLRFGSRSLVSPASLSHSSSSQPVQQSASSLRVQVGCNPGGQLSPSPRCHSGEVALS